MWYARFRVRQNGSGSKFIFVQVVLPSVPRVPFYLTAVVLVSVAIANILFVMRLFHVSTLDLICDDRVLKS